jgi:hypothetical protein
LGLLKITGGPRPFPPPPPSKSFLPLSISFHQFSRIIVILLRLQQHRWIRQTRQFSFGYRKHWTQKHIHIVLLFLRHVRRIAKATVSLVVSVRPHGTTGLPLDGFSWNFIFEYFSKICWEISSFIKKMTRITRTLQEDQYTFLSHLAEFFLEWKMSQTKVVDNIKTQILALVTLFFENRAVYELMWENM